MKNCYECNFAKIGNWCKKKLKIITSPYITHCDDFENERGVWYILKGGNNEIQK
uniref:Uncharacterized protein n=1 Tax=viral metagenome TaxID=1070528 RepID=A0A6M3LAI8_9ZZZZ